MAANVHDVIMLFGDSITEMSSDAGGLHQKLSAVYNRRLDVLNRGYSGFTTKWAIPVLEQLIAIKAEQPHVPKIRLLTIWLGANDAAIPENRQGQHVPLGEYVANLTTLIRMVKDPSSAHYSPDTKVVLITPTPVNTIQWTNRQAIKIPPEPLDRFFDLTRTYAEKAKEVGEKEGVAVLDAWTALWKAAGEVEGNLSAFSTDGLHLNADGYQIVYDELIKIIAEKFPALHYEKLQTVFVQYFEIDRANPRPGLQKRVA